MRTGDFQLEVVVNDKPVFEYLHQGDTYIEGRKGSTFKLRFYNYTSHRVLVVPSVDGISTLDGKPAHADSPGLIAPANGSVIIPGWMVDQTRASEFVFSDREASYARSVDRTTPNTGVIGVMVFAEEEQRRYYPQIPTTVIPTVQPWDPWKVTTGYPPFQPTWSVNNMGMADVETSSAKSLGEVNQLNVSVDSVSYNTSSALPQNSILGGPALGTSGFGTVLKTIGTTRRVRPETEEALGVGWGQSVNFATNMVEFDKGSSVATFVVFYDTRKNLERRGIIVDKPTPTRPNPFPGMGCTPPKGWQG